MLDRLATPRALVAAFVFGALACAPVTIEREPLSFEPSRRGRASDEITREEVRRVEGATAADVVTRLRPQFLQFRASPATPERPVAPSVFLNGTYAGGVEMLGTIPLAPIFEIRYLTPVAARSHYGSFCRCEGGVILVRTQVDQEEYSAAHAGSAMLQR